MKPQLHCVCLLQTGASSDCPGLPGGVCPGAGRKHPGTLSTALPWPSSPPLFHRLLRDEPGSHRPPVCPHPAVLGLGHVAGLPLAIWPSHVQDRELGHHAQHVRQRLLPHCHERDPLPLAGDLAEDGASHGCRGSCQVGQFGHLDGVTGGDAAPCSILHHSSGWLHPTFELLFEMFIWSFHVN